VSWTLIESDEALRAALEELSRASYVAVDTEFMRRDTYYPQIALLQLCAGDHAYLVDPLRVSALDEIRALLTDPEVAKLLHSCSEDLEVFRRWLGVLPSPLIDTQRAAGLLGEKFGLGYRALVETLLGETLDKGETRSNWLKRPLSEAQCHYAALDVLLLLPAWKILHERAEAAGRMAWLREEGEEAAGALAARERDVLRRVKGSGRLNPRELEVLKRLCAWREARAQALDRPRGWVLDDKACVAIARTQPEDPAALATIEGLPAAVIRRQGDTLLELVRAAREAPVADLPVAARPLGAEQRAQVKALREVLSQAAEALGISPEAALATSDLELLVREAGGETIVVPERWRGWRAQPIIQPLRAAVQTNAGAP